MGVCRLNSNFLKAWKNDERFSKFSVTSVSVSKESETIIYVALGTAEVWKCPYKVTSARCFPMWKNGFPATISLHTLIAGASVLGG